MDRVSRWSQGIDTTCVLCKNATETRSHLFFECSFSSQIWEQLTKGIVHSSYSTSCEATIRLISGSMDKKRRFCISYAFQVDIYSLWRERNKRRHGDQPMPQNVWLSSWTKPSEISSIWCREKELKDLKKCYSTGLVQNCKYLRYLEVMEAVKI